MAREMTAPVRMTRRSALTVFGCCWLTYMAVCMCRVNFSSALRALQGQLSAPVEQIGTIGTAYFGVYAVGQLVNGFFSARIRPVRFIVVGLLGTITCNLAVAYLRTMSAMWVVWSLNGYFQSMFWSTIIRVLAYCTLPNWRTGVSIGIFTSIPVSYALSWSVLGTLLDGGPAAPYFVIPAVVALAAVSAWLIVGRVAIIEPAFTDRSALVANPLSTLRQIARLGLTPLMVVCVFHGLIKEGIAFWFPLLLGNMMGDQTAAKPALLLIVPLSYLGGMLMSRLLISKTGHNPLKNLVIVYAVMAVCALALTIMTEGAAVIGIIGLISCLSYATHTVLLSYVPMQYTDKSIVSSFVGLLDFSSYVGAAVSIYALSRAMSGGGLGGVPAIWGGCAVVAAVFIGVTCNVMARRSVASVHQPTSYEQS